MKPEIETILNQIGWQKVKKLYPGRAQFIEEKLTPTGGLFATKATVASDQQRRILEVLSALEDLVSKLENLPSDQRDCINMWSCPVDERENGIPDRVGRATASLTDLVPGFRITNEGLLWESQAASKSSRPRNVNVYRVAEAVAEIYVIGTGKRPGYGSKNVYTGQEGTPFARAVSGVFAILGIQAEAKGPCEAARQAMTPERMKELRRPSLPPLPSLFSPSRLPPPDIR
jgi:hypothetical protein